MEVGTEQLRRGFAHNPVSADAGNIHRHTGKQVLQPSPFPRHVRLFRNSRSQAIRIPVEFESPGDQAMISRDGDRLIIEPVRKAGLAALLDSWEPLDENLREINLPTPAPEEIF